jgi:two-component sensor histidine kinase
MQAKRRIPVVGILLVAAVLLMSVVRTLLGPELGVARYATGVVRSAEIVLDIAFLELLSRRLDARGVPAVRAALTMLFLNVAASEGFAFAARPVIVALGVDGHRSVAWVTGDAFVTSLYLFALWTLGFRYPALVSDAHARRAEADSLRQKAELLQLRAHLQPHFVRNTLNAVAALVGEQPREARRMLATLGDLLTDSLEAPGQHHTLDEEVAWLQRYAEILEQRHHGALEFRWDVEPSARGTVIPPFLLQPLVENAALHGALSRDGDGLVAVRARRREDGRIEIAVEDNGPGFDRQAIRAQALGLHLVRRRLELECPGSTFQIDPTPSGTRAVVVLP